MSFDPNEVYAELIKAGNSFADADATANQMEELKSVLLSQLKLQYEGGDAAREMHAKASEAYEAHIKGMVEARRLANRARARWISVQALADARRTQAATLRAEARLA